MANVQVRGLAELATKLERLPEQMVDNKYLAKSIEKATTKFFDAWKSRWYDATYLHGSHSVNADGHGFAQTSGELYHSIKLRRKFLGLNSGISGTGKSGGKFKFVMPFEIVTDIAAYRRPIRNVRKVISAKNPDKKWMMFIPAGTNTLVETPTVLQHARTKGMDRWMEDRFNKTMQASLGAKWSSLGIMSNKKFIGD